MSFDSILSSDPRTAARFDAACGVLVNHMQGLGVVLTAEELRQHSHILPALRLSCLTDDALDVEAAAREITKGLPSVATQARLAALKVALEARTPDAIAQYDGLSSVAKMAIGRQLLTQANATNPKPQLTAEEEARLLRLLQDVRSPADKLTLARKWGLCK